MTDKEMEIANVYGHDVAGFVSGQLLGGLDRLTRSRIQNVLSLMIARLVTLEHERDEARAELDALRDKIHLVEQANRVANDCFEQMQAERDEARAREARLVDALMVCRRELQELHGVIAEDGDGTWEIDVEQALGVANAALVDTDALAWLAGQRREAVESFTAQFREWLDDRADVLDGDSGPIPNLAMDALQEMDRLLAKARPA